MYFYTTFRFLFSAMIAITVWSAAVPAQAASAVSRLESVPCWFEVAKQMSVRCFEMHVAPSRGVSPVHEIEFPVVILQASGEPKVKDAVLIPGGGGPGNAMGLTQSGVESLWRANDWVLDSGREVVLIDPRGVSPARPSLTCHEFGALVPRLWSQYYTSTEELALTLQALQECKARLKRDHVDLNAFNTDATAADLEELRRLLEIDQWNIYGTSYGANLALAIAQRDPQHVRSLILDSFQPLDIRFFDRYAQTVNTAFEQFFEQCRTDVRCRRDYPDLKKTLERVVTRADAQPLHLTIAHPYTLDPFPVVLSGTDVLSLLRSALYNEDDIAGLPEIIYALSRGSTDLLAPMARDGLREDLDKTYSDGVHLSVNCREEVPFNDMHSALQQANNYPLVRDLILSVLEYYQSVCQLWDVAPAAAASIQPAQVDVPALVLAGALDPVTPAQWSAQSKGRFRRVYRQEFAGVAHDVMAATYCAVIVAGRFLDDPQRDPLDHPCLQEERRIRFRLLVSGVALRKMD